MRMRLGVIGVALAALWATPCLAQVVTAMDQVQARPPAAVVSAAPSQVTRAGKDATTVSQLPADARERTPFRDDGIAPESAPPSLPGPLAPQARNAGSVDPDEIARLLDRGEAASIDAAAAIASGANVQNEQAPLEDDEAAGRRPNGMELVVPPRS